MFQSAITSPIIFSTVMFVRAAAEKCAISCGTRKLTYGQIAEQVNRAGNGLLALGIQEEQRVLLLLPDVPEFAIPGSRL